MALSPRARPAQKTAPPKARLQDSGLNVLSEEMHAECAACFARVSDDPLANAFARKTAVHAGMSGGKVPKEDIPAVLERVRTTKRQGQAAAYVHLPYCESKCLYCGFFGGKYSKEAEAAYVRALIGEIEAEAACASVTSAPVNALYLGGGTPTALQARELYLVLRTLKNTLPLANDCEITVEGRMHNFDEEKIEACLKAGANRFSLGVQSFDTRIRRSLGRIASGEDVCRRLETLASYNEAAIVIDLIYGLPGQSLEDWAGDIRTFLSLPLDGVDLYQLNVFPGSGLAKAMEAGKIPSAAMLAEQGAFFRQGIAMMRDARCNRLSMSHWSRSSRERNCYNPLVKSRADCLHYGAGGGGALQGWFMINEPDPARYIEHCTSGNKPVAMVAAPPDDLPVIKVILKQMEQCRLNLDDVGNALALCGGNRITDAAALYAPLIANWREAGLVTLDGPWMELTVPGQFWMVNLAQALLGWQSRMGKE